MTGTGSVPVIQGLDCGPAPGRGDYCRASGGVLSNLAKRVLSIDFS